MTTSTLHVEREAQIEQFTKLPDLDIPGIGITKEPANEAMVVALLHELIGKGLLDLKMVGESYATEHDAVYKNPAGGYVLAEYKLKLSDYCRDADENTKIFYNTVLVVCWSVRNITGEYGLIPLEVSNNSTHSSSSNSSSSSTHSSNSAHSSSSTNSSKTPFKGVNYLLKKDGVSVPVICLKDFCEGLRDSR